MASVNQLKQIEQELADEFSAYVKADPKSMRRADVAEIAKRRWHFNKLAAAREYTFRMPTVRHELPGELGVNELVLKHDYNPDVKTWDQAWTERDSQTVEYLRAKGLPQSYDECVAEGDTESSLALYLEARDLIVSPEQVAEEQQPQDERAWAVIVEQVKTGEATLWQCDLYTPSVRFADDGRFVRFDHLAYDDEIGLHERESANA